MTENCSRFSELASAYVDGETTDSESQELEAHLSSCTLCSAEVRSFMAMKASARSAMAAGECPAPLRIALTKVLDAMSETSLSRPVRRQWWSLAWLPSAAAAAAIAMFFLLPPTLPLHQLSEDGFSISANEAFTTPSAAVQHMGYETGIPARAVSLEEAGLTFVSAGRAKVGNCRGCFLGFTDSQKRHILVYQICPGHHRIPRGESLAQYWNGARYIRTQDGCTVVYWPQNDLIIAICTELPMKETAGLARLVQAKLETK